MTFPFDLETDLHRPESITASLTPFLSPQHQLITEGLRKQFVIPIATAVLVGYDIRRLSGVRVHQIGHQAQAVSRQEKSLVLINFQCRVVRGRGQYASGDSWTPQATIVTQFRPPLNKPVDFRWLGSDRYCNVRAGKPGGRSQ